MPHAHVPLPLLLLLLSQADDQQIVAGTMRQLVDVDFGAPLHCLVIAGQVHVTEEEMIACYRIGSVAAAGASGSAE